MTLIIFGENGPFKNSWPSDRDLNSKQNKHRNFIFLKIMETSSYINLIIDEKIALADDLIEKLEENFIEIDGAKKTKRNIEKEKKFLIKVSFKNVYFITNLMSFFSLKLNVMKMLDSSSNVPI